MKRKTILIFSIALLLLVNFGFIIYSVLKKEKNTRFFADLTTEVKTASYKIPLEKISETRSVVSKNKFNDKICFMIDMRLPSEKNRFFVYDLKRDSIALSGLVAHGNCYQYWLEGRRYNNEIGGGCTSLGKYKVGNSYNGRFGRAYKLHGLDKTNSNAYERFVVLHSYDCVPDIETTDDICQSNGCPMVSPAFLKKLQKIIDKSDMPILLFIYG